LHAFGNERQKGSFNYYELLSSRLKRELGIAKAARSRGYDLETTPEIKVAKDLAERVEALVGISGIADRIRELEREHGREVAALKIGLEVAEGKFKRHSSKIEAVEDAVRVAVAVLTEGVVAAPIEGISRAAVGKNDDGTQYVRVFYSGPIRSAGGTAQALSVLVADYVRRALGFSEYKPNEEEVERYVLEISMYRRYKTLQYTPSDDEVRLIVRNCPVCIDGEPTEEQEVEGYRDLKRVETNKIRGGMVLVISEGIALKAPKLKKYVEALGIAGWGWLEKIKGKTGESDEASFLKDIIAGRPVLAHPSRKGGFRLRYGRARNTGLAAIGLNPATMEILGFTAVGTQLKVELPGKGACVAPVDSIEGPTVKIGESVVRIDGVEEACHLKDKITEILDLGEILIDYGDFLENNHVLLPAAYSHEWWLAELERVSKKEALRFKRRMPTPEEAVFLSERYGVPLHPKYTFLWDDLSPEDKAFFAEFIVKNGNFNGKNLHIPHERRVKRILEDLLVPHRVKDGIIFVEDALPLLKCLNIESENGRLKANLAWFGSCINVRNKAPTRVGARMGRPEKSKERKMKPAPHVLFPLGDYGGVNRSLREALEKSENGTIVVEIGAYRCLKCGDVAFSRVCERCGAATKFVSKKQRIDLESIVRRASERVGVHIGDNERTEMKTVKGVKGLISEDKAAEPLEKGLLRAKHGVFVFKDGTIRYDLTNMPLTHFLPREVGLDVETAKELGYTYDYLGRPLESDCQILELKQQDIIISEDAAEYLLKVSKFVDELLVKFYGLEPYYNAEKKEDLIGALVIALAPHTSAGVLARIVGFTKAQVCYAHPFFHAAKRRNCLYPKEKVLIKDKEGIKLLEIEKVVESYKPDEIEILHYDSNGGGRLVWRKPKGFVKLEAPDRLVRVETDYGRRITVTPDHKFLVFDGKRFVEAEAMDLCVGDIVLAAAKIPTEDRVHEIRTLDGFLKSKDCDEYRAHGLKSLILKKVKAKGISIRKLCEFLRISTSAIFKDSIPLSVLPRLFETLDLSLEEAEFRISHRKKFIAIPSKIELSEELGFLVGIYLANGFASCNGALNQISIVNKDEELLNFGSEVFTSVCGYKPSRRRRRDGTYVLVAGGKPIYEFFVSVLSVGKGARDKRIPWAAFNNRKFALGILSGFVCGDGHVGKEVSVTSVSEDLVNDLVYLMLTLGVFPGISYETRTPTGEPYRELKARIYSRELVEQLLNLSLVEIGKIKGFKAIPERRGVVRMEGAGDAILVRVQGIEWVESGCKHVYDFVIDGNKTFVGGVGGLITVDCDGDEDAVMLLLDGLLNFSTHFLPEKRGGKMDAPLLLTTWINPKEIDKEAHNVSICERYPLEFYEATLQLKSPKDVDIEIAAAKLECDVRESGAYGFSFTHDVSDVQNAPTVSLYRSLGSMSEKMEAQLRLAKMIRAVDESDVAERILIHHFIPDLKGNLRAFGTQAFRCTRCNAKYRRPPLGGRCRNCGNKLVPTVHAASVAKYLDMSLHIAKEFAVSEYTRQRLLLIENEIRSLLDNTQRSLSEFGTGGLEKK